MAVRNQMNSIIVEEQKELIKVNLSELITLKMAQNNALMSHLHRLYLPYLVHFNIFDFQNKLGQTPKTGKF